MIKTITTILVIFSLFELLPAQGITFSSNCEQTNFCSYEVDCGPAFAELIAIANTDCIGGLLNYEYNIDLFDDGSVNLAGFDNDASGDFPIGTHKLTFNASDDCGNSESCEFLFSIKDCVAPTPSILNGMAANIEASGEVVFLAETFNNGSFDNCGITSYLIVSPSQGPGQTEPPAEASSSFTFTCLEIGSHNFDFWVSDEAGNWNYTSGYLIIQDNDNYCLPGNNSFLLCAFSKTEQGNYIQNVNYQLGGYSVPGLPDPNIFLGRCVTIYIQYITGSLTLNPTKDIDHLNGVSTFDLVLISQHILGIQALSSPYKIIAADANNSGSVSTIDLVEIRKLILGINLTFPNNTSWRFVDSAFVFPNPSNPWATAFPELCIINTFDEDVTKNYIGMKIGDVNGSAIPNDSLFVVDDRTINENLIFQLENQKFEAGEVVQLPFKAKYFKEISGFQFELTFENEVLEFQDFEKGALAYFDETNFGLNNIQNGELVSSWVNLNFDQKDLSNEVLFYLEFKALQAGNLKDLIKITENRLKAEAYDSNLEVLDLQIEFSENGFFPIIELYQNQPNPFYENTSISFYLDEAQFAALKIFDIHGAQIKVYFNYFDAGLHQFKLKATDIPSTGLYFYQLVTEDETFTKKMIKL